MSLLSASCQEVYAYHVHGVDSNDKLYGAGSKFIAELQKILNMLVEQLLQLLKTVGEKSPKKQSQLCVAFVNCVLAHGNPAGPGMVRLVHTLWGLLAQLSGQYDVNLVRRLNAVVERRSGGGGYSELMKVMDQLDLQG